MKKIFSIFLAACCIACLAALPAMAAGPGDFAPPANLNALSQAEQLAYFNLVANRVRAEKPGFKQRERSLIGGMYTSSASMQRLMESILSMTSGLFSEWTQSAVAAGQSNEDFFLSKNTNASDLRPEDIVSISCEKVGGNWMIDLLVQEETNPAPGLDSANARIADILTRESLLVGMEEVGISADPADITVRHFNGFARVTVNTLGQVIVATNGYQAEVQIDSVSVSTIVIPAVVITLNCEWQYAYFDWAAEEPFPPGHFSDPTPPPLKWWQRLPSWLQFILRWIFFGWLWMN